jgi:hypothetical protein
MPERRTDRALVFMAALVLCMMACRAATNLVFPAAPTAVSVPRPPAPAPTETPATVQDAVCVDLRGDILRRAQYAAEGGGPGSAAAGEPETTYLVSYRVDGDQIRSPQFESVPAEFDAEQSDTEAHRRLWEYFAALIPADQRTMLTGFVIGTDGPDNLLAAVAQAEAPEAWALEVDIRDAGDPYDYTYTLLHEFGHLLTLNAGQVPPSRAIFDDPDDGRLYDREDAACDTYFPGEGCSRPESYINAFFALHWTGLYAEWQDIDREEDDEVYEERLDDFYRANQDQFVTDYAPTSPVEDIAESWSFFVLAARPEGDGAADRKVRFFYDYPELVDLRNRILGNLCEAFPR